MHCHDDMVSLIGHKCMPARSFSVAEADKWIDLLLKIHKKMEEYVNVDRSIDPLTGI